MTSTSSRPAVPDGGSMGGSTAQFATNEMTALFLRLGLGAVFTIGGWSKLSQLIDPARSDAIVALYTGPKGYINTFFL
ncbi:MAG: hypothetical protein AAFR75_13585, partial [Pseudomonadota bacterium]